MAEGLTVGKTLAGIGAGALLIGGAAIGFPEAGEALIGDSTSTEAVAEVVEAVSKTGENTVDAVSEKLAAADHDLAKYFNGVDAETQQLIIDSNPGNVDIAEKIARNYDANKWNTQIGNKLIGAGEWTSETLAKGANLVGDGYTSDHFDSIGFKDDIGIIDVAKDAGTAAWAGAETIPSVISDHPVITGGAATLAAVGTYKLTQDKTPTVGKHTASVNAARAPQARSGIQNVARTTRSALEGAGQIGGGVIRGAGKVAGGVGEVAGGMKNAFTKG